MSGPLGSQQWMYSTGFYPYEIDQSLRFNDDDSAYLSRSFSGIPETWTLSFWVKRGNISTTQILFAGRTNGGNSSYIGFNSDKLYILFNGAFKVQTTRLFRDTSAWYHIVVSVTENSTSYCYVNGEEVASWSEGSTAYLFSSAYAGNAIGRLGDYNGLYYDGYMAEVNFIDGQALDPTDFGEFKSGVWIPKSYSGSYGTDGFYLDFGNSGSLGADSSGNGNDWTPTNLAATDQVPDSPTNNFATLNPLAKNGHTLSEGNCRYTASSSSDFTCKASYGVSSGKWYWEVFAQQLNDANNERCQIGITGASSPFGVYLGYGATDYTYYSKFGDSYNNNVSSSYGATYGTGDIIGVALDLDAGTLTFYKNNSSQGVAFSSLSGEFSPALGIVVSPMSLITNFGQDSSFAGNKTAQGNTDANGIGDFYYAPPAGYLALCTANLPDPAIDPAQDDVPEDYFNTVLYTATGNDNLAITGVGFQPDFVWIKSRSSAYSHNVYDGVRGVSKRLQTNLTNAESSPISGVKSFDADGFTLGIDTADTNYYSGVTYVSWNWLADNTSGSTNTDGTITSTVSANQKAGFSIVTFSQSSSGTIGHGLTSAPELIIMKDRDSANNWQVYSSPTGATNKLLLNSTAASTSSGVWSNTAPTSSVFSSAFNAGSTLAYCFHSVEGYSKFGSYTGNGSADGPFVYTGFRPAFVIIKRTDTTGHQWSMWDAVRNTYNVAGTNVWADSNEAEVTSDSGYGIDITSNGFKLRNTHAARNASGGTYIYMAFAEMPFKYSNAR